MKKRKIYLDDWEWRILEVLWDAGKPMSRIELYAAMKEYFDWGTEVCHDILKRIESQGKGYIVESLPGRYMATIEPEDTYKEYYTFSWMAMVHETLRCYIRFRVDLAVAKHLRKKRGQKSLLKSRLDRYEYAVMSALWISGKIRIYDLVRIALSNEEGPNWDKYAAYRIIRKCEDKGYIDRTYPESWCEAAIRPEQVYNRRRRTARIGWNTLFLNEEELDKKDQQEIQRLFREFDKERTSKE